MMEADGTLVLNLRAETNGIVGHSQIRYSTDDPDYQKILKHVGADMMPGDERLVAPFPD